MSEEVKKKLNENTSKEPKKVPFEDVFDHLISTVMEIKRNYKNIALYAESATKRIKELESKE